MRDAVCAVVAGGMVIMIVMIAPMIVTMTVGMIAPITVATATAVATPAVLHAAIPGVLQGMRAQQSILFSRQCEKLSRLHTISAWSIFPSK